jgi:hypothetical protein
MLMPRFTLDDQMRAHTEWGANCGPGAIAAITGLTLDQLRPNMGDFERKRYTNPTLMWEVLNRLGVKWHRLRLPLTWPQWGLARIQWYGPWTEPGVPARVAYRHTHWVGACSRPGNIGIFDINAINNGTGWCSLKNWGDTLVPWLVSETESQADGQWSLTHAVEVESP